MHRAHFEVVANVDQRHWWFVARRRILRDVLACVVPPDRQSTVIDVGCGTGANIAALADLYRCIGIDASSDAIALARECFPNVHYICGHAPADLGAESAQAKAMLVMDVLEHVEDDRAVFEPLAHALRPGAVVLLTVPADMRLWSDHDVGLQHYRRYDLAMLRALWKGLPLEPIAITHFCKRLYPLARVERSLHRMRSHFFSPRHRWDMRVPTSPINRLLERTFEGESRTLVDLVEGRRNEGYSYGVSLMALLRRRDALTGAALNGPGGRA